MRFKIALSGLLCVAILLVAQASFVSAQEDGGRQKKIAIRRLIEVSELSRHTASVFEELMALYMKNWAVTVIADLKAKGLFKGYSSQQTAKMENVINEFSNEIFDGIRNRMRAEIFTPDSLENMVGPTFNKYLSETEIDELIVFTQSPSSQKLIDTYYKVMREAVVMKMKEKGLFDVQASPDAEKSKLDKLKKESENNPYADINKILSNVQRLAAETYTESEKQELSGLAKKPLGAKLAQILPSMTVEIQSNSARLYGPQVSNLTQEVIDEQLKTLDQRLKEVLMH